jgi:LysM repeat protein
MRRQVLRFWSKGGIVLLLALMLVAGCTRAKSSGPPEPTSAETSAAAGTQTPGAETALTPSPSGEDAIAATTTAWAVQTATAAAGSPETTEGAPVETSEATESPELTAPAPTSTPTTAVTPAPTQLPAPTQPPVSGGERTHTVQAGENLFRIALKYGLSYQTLASYNGIANPQFIYVGQVLKIPPSGSPVEPPSQEPGYHVVQRGENLFRIALRYDMSYERLAAANGIGYPYTIYVGQRLIIP